MNNVPRSSNLHAYHALRLHLGMLQLKYSIQYVNVASVGSAVTTAYKTIRRQQNLEISKEFTILGSHALLYITSQREAFIRSIEIILYCTLSL